MTQKTKKFSTIALTGRSHNPEIKNTLEKIISFLTEQKINIVLNEEYARLINSTNTRPYPILNSVPYDTIDLVIVIGGDGSLLDSARDIVPHHIPIIGINRGRKGFLADIAPQQLIEEITPILNGHYLEERRFLLQAELLRDYTVINQGTALNDVVVYSGHVARMIEFEITINKTFVYKQRSDGLITSTPTGSTAYALSGGGPIVHPHLDAIVLVPMHPHTLSSRPLVVHSDVCIELHLTKENQLHPRCSLDGQQHFDMLPGDVLKITRHPEELRLLHPQSYDYYHTLRSKLGWGHPH